MKFSLILATVDRTDEISGLLKSLNSQSYHDFELIVIDQNDDNRLESLIRRFETDFPIIHLKSGRGLSKARNIGLKKAAGDIVAFPDDDCLYPPDLIEKVHDWMSGHPEYAGVSGQTVDDSGRLVVGSYDRCSGNVSKLNIWKRMNSAGFFVRKEVIEEKIFFDERLGIGAGTPWGSAEDIDLPLKMLSRGYKIYYEPSLKVIHPPAVTGYDDDACDRALRYGGGMGYVVNKHNYPLWFKAGIIIRPCGGILLSLFSFRPGKARFHFNNVRGRLGGLMA